MDLLSDHILYIATFIPLLYLPSWAQVCQTLNVILHPFIQNRANNFIPYHFKHPYPKLSKKWFAHLYYEAGQLIPHQYQQNKKENKFIVLTHDIFAYEIDKNEDVRTYIIKYAKEDIFNYTICASDIRWYIHYDREQYYFDNIDKYCPDYKYQVDPIDAILGTLVHQYYKIEQKIKTIKSHFGDLQLEPFLYDWAFNYYNVDALNWLYDNGTPIVHPIWVKGNNYIKITITTLKWIKEKSLPLPPLENINFIPKEVLEMLHNEWSDFSISDYISNIIKTNSSDKITELMKCRISLYKIDAMYAFNKCIKKDLYDLFIWMHQNGAKWPHDLILLYKKERIKYIKFAFEHGYTPSYYDRDILVVTESYYEATKYLIETKQIVITPEYIQLAYKFKNKALLLYLRDNNLLQ